MTAKTYSIDAKWPHAPKEGAPDVANISIYSDDIVLTRLVDFERKDERDYVRGSAVSLGLWLADNWWRLRHESLPNQHLPTADWRLRHEMTSVPGGTLWPPLMIHGTGDRVLLTPTYGRPLEIGTVRYNLPPVQSVRGDAFEQGTAAFLEAVVETCLRARDGATLQDLLQILKDELVDPDIVAWRRLEARLGFDRDEAPDAVMGAFTVLEDVVGDASLDEAASAYPGPKSAEMLGLVVEASQASKLNVKLDIAEGLPRDRIKAGLAPPWELGRDAAFQVRQVANLPDGPLRSPDFADLFQTTMDNIRTSPATARKLRYAARSYHQRGHHRVAVQSPSLRNRRFELACVLGDAIWERSNFGIVSSAKTDRQKFQRAFAQNLLAPYADVRRHIDENGPTHDQIDHSANYFNVHYNVIERLLVLQGVLPRETLESRVEAA